MGFGGSGGGSSSIAGSSDVALSSLANNHVLAYDGATAKWKNKPQTGGLSGVGVTTVKVLTQAEYDALPSPDATTMYVVVPA